MPQSQHFQQSERGREFKKRLFYRRLIGAACAILLPLLAGGGWYFREYLSENSPISKARRELASLLERMETVNRLKIHPARITSAVAVQGEPLKVGTIDGSVFTLNQETNGYRVVGLSEREIVLSTSTSLVLMVSYKPDQLTNLYARAESSGNPSLAFRRENVRATARAYELAQKFGIPVADFRDYVADLGAEYASISKRIGQIEQDSRLAARVTSPFTSINRRQQERREREAQTRPPDWSGSG